MNNIPLEELFNGMQEQMKAQLNTNRSFIEHPGSKGDAAHPWMRGMPGRGPDLGAPAPMPGLRPCRLLRRVDRQTCDGAFP